MQAPIPTLHHTHTHMSGTHASFQMIPTFSWTSSGETLMIYGPRIVYPRRHSSDRGSPAYLSLVLCLIMAWDDVKPCWFTSWGTILPGFTVTGRFTLYGSGSFASRLERMHARGDTCKHLYQPLTTLTHIC